MAGADRVSAHPDAGGVCTGFRPEPPPPDREIQSASTRMACKFHAPMSHPRTLPRWAIAGCLTVGVLATAHAEKADRFKPITIQADQTGQVDLQKQVATFNGN